MNRFVPLLCLLIGLTTDLSAQVDTRPLVEGVGVDEHLGEFIDPELRFTDRQGEEIRLGDLMKGDQPIIFAPVYYSCPNLCTLVLNGVRDLINDMDLVPGKEYKVINISFDPANTPQLAETKAGNYAATLKNRAAADHWFFLTGTESNIHAFTEAVGFKYKFINGQFSHASVLVLASPQGKITRYLYGVRYDANDARMALVEASAGKVGSTLEKVFVYCFRYDPLSGKYVPIAWRVLRIGGVITLVALGAGALFLWKMELTRKRRLRPDV
jgi:protein SCO1/2